MSKNPKFSDSIVAAESMRDARKHDGFIAGLLESELRIKPFIDFSESQISSDGQVFAERLAKVLKDKVDTERFDMEQNIPDEVIDAFRRIGAFGIKIPKEYGGLGLSQSDYHNIAILIGGHCTGTTALLSAHNSIGVPEPVKQFGNNEQKARFLTRVAGGEISGFALTERGAGCDISQIKTCAVRVKKRGATVGYKISCPYDHKVWITNSAKNDNEFLASLLVVIARVVDSPKEIEDPKSPKIFAAFVVDTNEPGCKVLRRLRFSGAKAIFNGEISFDDVYVPKENMLGKEDDGQRVGLNTLTIGRLTLPAACLGGMKKCLWFARLWGKERVQWGRPVGEHGQNSEKIVRMASRIMALEAIVKMTGQWVDRGLDIRLESAAAKIIGAEWLWESVVDLSHIRGGRGFETVGSLAARGELPFPVERMLRDAVINRTWEGTSDIMRLWLGREVLNEYKKIEEAVSKRELINSMRALLFYCRMLTRSSCLSFGLGHGDTGLRDNVLNEYLEFAQGTSKHLVKLVIRLLLKHRHKIQFKQLVLKELVDTLILLFAMTSAIYYYRSDVSARKLLLYFCEDVRRTVGPKPNIILRMLNALSSKPDISAKILISRDTEVYNLVSSILNGEMEWLENGILKTY